MKFTMQIYRFIPLAALLGIASGCAAPFYSLTPEQIRTDLEGVRERYFVPSLGVAEISAEQIITYGPVGQARSEPHQAVTAGSWYQLGSCTKAMTATALVKLMQAGKLSWETRLLEVFPEFAETAHPDYRDITLGDLVAHQAGFYPAGDVRTWERLQYYPGSKAQYLGENLSESSWIRRGRYAYSNSGYAALGAVIERRTGLPYAAAMNKLLFDPLRVKAYLGYPKDIGADQPWGYTSNWGAAAAARGQDQYIPAVLGPAGLVSMTLRDFARFVQLHLRGLRGRDDAGFSAAMIQQLHQPRVETGMPFAQTYAAGWLIEQVNGETIHWHNGSAGNFYVLMAINPARNKAVAIVTNVGPLLGHRVAWDILERMLTGPV